MSSWIAITFIFALIPLSSSYSTTIREVHVVPNSTSNGNCVCICPPPPPPPNCPPPPNAAVLAQLRTLLGVICAIIIAIVVVILVGAGYVLCFILRYIGINYPRRVNATPSAPLAI
ncbi:hypothetical protein FRX31_002054 [Thalictrum thalictroides]|uniref:Transmembrane protein n=1 Tax=Thalictrum thalictroides TaxID=46969 RepID=A0A7J6XGM9_THATH|nr:hypothetical protein FRX31_002054 [Thalictrum thalictroides]